MVGIVQVYLAKDSSPIELLSQCVNARKRVWIEYGLGIKLAVVNTHP